MEPKLGRMAAVIGKRRETLPAEALADYDAAKAEMTAKAERLAREAAEWNAAHPEFQPGAAWDDEGEL